MRLSVHLANTIVIALCAIGNPSIALAEIEFAKHRDGSLSLLGDNPEELLKSCESLREYFIHIALRNGRSTQSHSCRPPVAFDPGEQFQTTFHEFQDAEFNKLLKRSDGTLTHSISLPFFPDDFASRTNRRPQDGVCYNTALVESGIMPESSRSSFFREIDHFLGSRGLAKLRHAGKSVEILVGARSTSPLIEFRAAFETAGATPTSLKAEMDRVIGAHFTPGSVLCVDSDRIKDVASFRRDMAKVRQTLPAGTRLRTNIANLPQDFYGESAGGHCLVFLTPTLISETNQRQQKRLLSWARAFEGLSDLLRSLNPQNGGTLFYYQLNRAEVQSGAWVNSQLEASQPLRILLGLTERHRHLYEGLKARRCEGDEIDLYSESCVKMNPEALSELKRFWKDETKITLMSPELAEIRKVRSSHLRCAQWAGTPDLPACEIYGAIVELISRMNIEN